MRSLKTVLNFVLSLCLMLSLAGTLVVWAFSATLLRSDYYYPRLAQTGYYNQLQTEVEEGLVSLGLASGLPPQVFQNSVDIDWLSLQGDNYINSIISYLNGANPNFSYTIDSKPLVNKLNSNIQNYATQAKVEITPSVQGALDQVVTQAINIVQNQVNIVDVQGSTLNKVRQVTHMLGSAKVLLPILDLGLLLLLWFVNLKAKHRIWRWLGYSLIACGLMVFLPAAMLLASSVLSRLAISNPYLRQGLASVVSGFVQLVMYSGLVTGLVGAFVIILRPKPKRRNQAQAPQVS